MCLKSDGLAACPFTPHPVTAHIHYQPGWLVQEKPKRPDNESFAKLDSPKPPDVFNKRHLLKLPCLGRAESQWQTVSRKPTNWGRALQMSKQPIYLMCGLILSDLLVIVGIDQ